MRDEFARYSKLLTNQLQFISLFVDINELSKKVSEALMALKCRVQQGCTIKHNIIAIETSVNYLIGLYKVFVRELIKIFDYENSFHGLE